MIKIKLKEEDVHTIIRMLNSSMESVEPNTQRYEQYKQLYTHVIYQIELSTDEDDDDF